MPRLLNALCALLQAYIEATRSFYHIKAPQYLEENGVQNYMKFADQKLREEEQRGEKYLESFSGSLENVRITVFIFTV